MEEIQRLHNLMEKLQCKTVEKIDLSKVDLETLLSLFLLSNTTVITLDNIKQAKTITNKLHPDKSQLPPIYFIFFKQAFLLILELYENTRKFDIVVDDKNTKYKDIHDNENKMGGDFLKDIEETTFNDSFNHFYEENYNKKEGDKKNDWFYENDIINDHFGKTDNLGIEAKILKIKEIQKEERKKKQTDIIIHTNIQSYNNGFHGSELFHTEKDEYLSSNSSSNLMYDDIRRVHRDETVFLVDQTDHDKMKELSLDDLTDSRNNNNNLTPMNKEEAVSLFDRAEDFRRDIYNRNKLKELNESKTNGDISGKFMSRFMNIL